jgi:hypothetical protein
MKRKIVGIISGILFLGLVACEEILIAPKANDEGGDDGMHYVIERGEHNSNRTPALKNDISVLAFQARFDSTAIYTTVKANNQGDINKLYGLSDCGSGHQENSARFGWRWYKNQLEILAYVYRDGQRDYKVLGTASFNVYHAYEIVFGMNQYVFKFDNATVTLPRHCDGSASGYKLFPYFGGDETAPHNVSIWIKE